MRYFVFIVGLIFALVSQLGVPATPVRADSGAKVYLFSQQTCPYCRKAERAIRSLDSSQSLQFVKIPVGQNQNDDKLYESIIRFFEFPQAIVPLVVIGDQAFIGFADDGRSKNQYLQAIEACNASMCPDLVAKIKRDLEATTTDAPNKAFENGRKGRASALPDLIELPIAGAIETKNLSLISLTIAMAAIDGFNPCAMWVLVFLIGLLLGIEDRLRIWILGGTFLLATAVMYFAVMAAWLNLLLVLGAADWIRVAIGLLAVGGGLYFLREFWTKPEASCHVTNIKRRGKIMEAFQKSVASRQLILSMAGIAVLAVLVNFIELICSAGIPAVYAQVLLLSDLSTTAYYGYLALYIAIFMLDDVAIFATAMFAMRAAGLTGRYARYSHLIGGGLLLAIGSILLLRPELLSFSSG